VFFMENLTTPWFLNGSVLATALEPQTKLQMIAAEDVGAFEARGFTEAERLNRREIDLAGDERTSRRPRRFSPAPSAGPSSSDSCRSRPSAPRATTTR
jgi:hypothetical protein